MTTSNSDGSPLNPIGAAYKKGRAAAAVGDERTALQFYVEVLESGAYIATNHNFLEDLLRLGDMGSRELSKYRDAAEAKIESCTATDMDIERWQVFNRALHDQARDVRLYNRVAGKDPNNTASRLIALISIVSRLNETQYNKESLQYVKDFVEQLSELRVSRQTWEQLHATGRRQLHFNDGIRVCIAAAVAENDQQLLQKLVDDVLNWTQDARLIFDLEKLANQHAALAQIFKQTFEQLGLKQQLALTIAKCLAEEDPEGLVDGAEEQRDEYLGEAIMLVPMLHARMTEAEFYETLCVVWSKMFGRVTTFKEFSATSHAAALIDGMPLTESMPATGYQLPESLRSDCKRLYSIIQPLLVRLPDTSERTS